MLGSTLRICAFLLLCALMHTPPPVMAQEVTPTAKLLPEDGAKYDEFGNAVDVSGNYAVVAAPDLRAAYVFVRDGASWTQQAKLFAGWTWDEYNCRTSVATTGDIVVVGAEHDEILGDSSRGSAYVYTRNGSAWSRQAQLLADDGTSGDHFGCSVAISGEVAVIGAPDDDNDLGNSAGAAYVFVRDGDTWSQRAKLLASDGEGFKDFGRSVAISGQTIVIGNGRDGQAYVFVNDGNGWQQQDKLAGGIRSNGEATVAVHGDTALIGNRINETADVFVRQGSSWTWQAELVPDRTGDFGWSVDLLGDVAVVGAPAADRAFVFVRNGTTWTQQRVLVSVDFGGGFPEAVEVGLSVSIIGDAVLAGAEEWWRNPDSGSAYVYLIEDDSDGDGVGDSRDAFPNDSTEWTDTDGDGIGNNSDSDDDNDGFPDGDDAFPEDPAEWLDSDGDGVGDNADEFPNDPTEWADSDGDGVGNNADAFPDDSSESADTDGDGVGDNADAFPEDPSEWTDSDADGCGDNGDEFPNDPLECLDTDGDGIGNNADPDDDNDGVADEFDDYPLGRFIDAPPGSFAFAYIEALARSGIDEGCGGEFFCRWAVVSRAEIAVLFGLARYGIDYVPPAATGDIFVDVNVGDAAAPYIELLFNDGITRGCGFGAFCPEDDVTRAQMAVFLLRAKHGANYVPPEPVGTFIDVGLNHWAAAWIEQLALEGITSGCGRSRFCPEAPVKRAHMAVFLVRTFDLL